MLEDFRLENAVAGDSADEASVDIDSSNSIGLVYDQESQSVLLTDTSSVLPNARFLLFDEKSDEIGRVPTGFVTMVIEVESQWCTYQGYSQQGVLMIGENQIAGENHIFADNLLEEDEDSGDLDGI